MLTYPMMSKVVYLLIDWKKCTFYDAFFSKLVNDFSLKA